MRIELAHRPHVSLNSGSGFSRIRFFEMSWSLQTVPTDLVAAQKQEQLDKRRERMVDIPTLEAEEADYSVRKRMTAPCHMSTGKDIWKLLQMSL